MIEASDLVEQDRERHEKFMQEALIEAQKAGSLGEVPIGSVLVHKGEIIARGFNVREMAHDAVGHAEIQAIQAANKALGAWRLEGMTLYVTLEPCPMCAGALVNSRIETVVYGAADPKAGCAGTLMNLLEDTRFNHRAQVIRGVMAESCGQILTDFFKILREKKKKNNLYTEQSG